MSKSRIDGELVFRIFLVIMFVGIIGVMVYFSIALRHPPAPTFKTVRDHAFVFTNQSGLWQTDWVDRGQVYTLYFRYLPSEVEAVPITGKINDTFFTGTIHVAFDPAPGGLGNLTLAAGELSLNLARGLQYTLVAACTNQSEACMDRPIVNCQQNQSLPIVYLKQTGDTEITLENNCITVSGEGKQLLKSVDKLLYLWYRIIVV